MSLLVLGGLALAEDKTAPTGNMGRDAHTSEKMKDPPNADGAQKGATGSTSVAGSSGGAEDKKLGQK